MQGGAGTAMDGMPGATSKDVHQGLGHPGQGMTSTEMRHDGQHGAKKQGMGLTGFGQSELKATDEREDPRQRALDKDIERKDFKPSGMMEGTAMDQPKDSA